MELSATGNASQTFETFVRGASNAFACGAAEKLAAGESTFNPLFIHGGSSLGKTHLLLAILDRLTKGRGGRVIYASCERFMNDLTRSRRERRLGAFRDEYRSCDALLLDDVQFVEREGRSALQDELLETFDDLREAGRPVVLAADVPPDALERLAPNLRERFDWGMIAEVQAPDVELRIAIVRAKAKALGLELSTEVVELVAGLDNANVRALEGAVKTLATFAAYHKRAVTLDDARQLLEPRLKAAARAPSVRDVQLAVAREFGLEMRDLLAKGRERRVTFPRQIAMYLARIYAKASLADIASAFRGKHHATVLHAVRKIERELESDADLKTRIATLARKLGRG